MKKLSILVFILTIFISCNKNKNSQENFVEIKNEENKIISDILLDSNNILEGNNEIENSELKEYIINFPKIMFVTSKEGLRIRSEPSIYGEVNNVLLYGQRVVIHERSEIIDNINGINDYWYRLLLDRRRNDWIFGGYISDKLSSDLPIILGKWDNINRQREYFNFAPNFKYSSGLKESSNGIWGSWNLENNIIMIFDLTPGMDYMAANYGLSDEDDWSVVLENNRLPSQNIKLKIIDNNNIILEFMDRIIELKRSDDLW